MSLLTLATRNWSVRRVIQTVGFAVLFLGIAVAVDLLVQYLPAVRALQAGRDAAVRADTDAKAALSEGTPGRFDVVAADLTAAHTDFTSSSSAIDDGWLTGLAAHLPWVGDQVRAAQAMRHAGAAGTQLGLDLIPVMKAVVPARGPAAPGGALQRLFTASGANVAALGRAQRDLADLDAALAAIPSSGLVAPLDHIRATLDDQGTRLASGAHEALTLLQAAPSALGSTERRYLLLMNNPAEERPGGGFIGAVGEIDIHNGQVVSDIFQDSVFADGHIPPEPAPKLLDEHLYHGVPWSLADSDWSANFPTAAATVSRMYREATGHTVDGVISVDPVALSYVLQVTGPISVPPYPQTISATNTLLDLNYIANKARPGDPGKVFLPPFGKALVERLLNPAPGQLGALVSALGRGVGERHIVFFFTDPALESAVTESSAGGVLQTAPFDTLQVTDANMSAGKQDLFVQRQFGFATTVAADSSVHDKLTLTYHNVAQTDPANKNLEPSLGAAYDDDIQVFVPADATLDNLVLTQDGSTSSVSPESIGTDYGRAVFTYFLSVPVGQSATLEFDYSGNFGYGGGKYGLDWTKEINALTWPITVDMQLPGVPARHWSSDLSVDRQFTPN
jgi:hypothetical protein